MTAEIFPFPTATEQDRAGGIRALVELGAPQDLAERIVERLAEVEAVFTRLTRVEIAGFENLPPEELDALNRAVADLVRRRVEEAHQRLLVETFRHELARDQNRLRGPLGRTWRFL